jgi:protein-disulfide isomerase
MKMGGGAGVLLLAAAACGAASASAPAARSLAPSASAFAPVPQGAPPQAWPSEEDAAIPVSRRNPSWGSRLALVTIVAFSDFQCPFCAMVEPTLTAIREAYGPDTVRIVWKNMPLPFHQNARPAAEAAMGVFALAGTDAFWKFHDLAFEDRQALGRDNYIQWAQAAGVTDVAAFAAGLDSHRWVEGVERDIGEAQAVNVEGTPSFFINGSFLNGAQPLVAFKKQIDLELDKARASIRAGTPRERLYAKLAAENYSAFAAAQAKDDAREKQNATAVFKIPLGNSPARGSASALVTIVEFSDFQCPFCARVEATLKALRDKYGEQLRLVWKNEPLRFHQAAEPAAEAALEVRAAKGDAAFWQVHDKFFAEQNSLSAGEAPDVEAIVRLAAAAGVDPGRVKKAIAGEVHRKEIDADEDLADDFEANGTPHFFINGRRLVGAQPQAAFEKVIDEEIVKARRLLAAGTKSPDLYAALIQDGKAATEPETRDVPSVSPGDPIRGDANAKVTIHEWADFQCPFCARVEPTLVRLVKDYAHRVRIVWHDLPLPMHPDAELAAQAGREAYAQGGAAAFWAMHDGLLAHQDKLKRDNLDDLARANNINLTRWSSALDAGTHSKEIEAAKQAGSDAGITGTPMFLIAPRGATRGYVVSGAQTYSTFRRRIERALNEAE